ncbi:MAG: MFS transporter [Chloroflexi bacterium]|nr:MAG: MFS transporter [Chloroflexota bacterium]MBL1193580.1 DHA2 family efflux MFS transporter permease subunit [Chloroflexota bacterium]NOH10871.1 MFS transporter [Chloroflexota bacterium]
MINQQQENEKGILGGAGLWVLVATILGSAIAFIDGTVVNVALPVLQEDLGATISQTQWIVEAYMLFLAALILVGGSLGDHFGRKRIYTIGIVIFALASAWAGLAPDANQLILARAVQGIGGALLTPGSLSIITAYFNESNRGQAIGIWSAFATLTTAGGPALGGWLVDNASWRWVFYINIPLAIIVLVILFWRVPESRDEEIGGELDWLGALLATLGLAGVTFGLVEASNLGLTSPIVIGSFFGGILALVAFIYVESRAKTPMMPLSVFRSPTFTGANLLTLFLYGALGGALFFYNFNFINLQGYTATQAGFAFLPFTIVLAVLSPWAGGLVARYGAKLPLVIGPLIVALAFYMLSLPGIGGNYLTTWLPGILVFSFGMAIVVAPLTTAVMGAVDVSHSGLASGVNNAFARTASLLAVAIFGLIAFFNFNTQVDTRLASSTLLPEAAQQIEVVREQFPTAVIGDEVDISGKEFAQEILDLAFLSSFRLMMYLGVGLSLLSSLVALILIEGKKPDAAPEPAEAETAAPLAG